MGKTHETTKYKGGQRNYQCLLNRVLPGTDPVFFPIGLLPNMG